jgi:hypothetical protein
MARTKKKQGKKEEEESSHFLFCLVDFSTLPSQEKERKSAAHSPYQAEGVPKKRFWVDRGEKGERRGEEMSSPRYTFLISRGHFFFFFFLL